MAGRILLSALLAAVAIFIWGFIYWAAIPFGPSTIKQIPNEDSVRSSLSGSLTESGAYAFPMMDMKEQDKEKRDAAEKNWREKYKAGPRGMVFYVKEGGEPMAPPQLVWGFIDSFIAALAMAVLLAMALPALPMYGQRILFVTLGGLFATLAVDLGYYNWWSFPANFVFAQALYTVIAWFIAGLVMGRIMGEMGSGVNWGGEGGSKQGGYTFMPPVFVRK